MPDPTSRPQASRVRNVVMSVVFFGLVSAPLVAMWLGTATDTSSTEMRRMAVKPQWGATLDDWLQYPARFEAYFNDHFGLREKMISANNFIFAELLRTSPVPEVMMGKDDWLFVASIDTPESFHGLRPLSAAELERWQLLLEGRRDWLASHGIKYLFAVAPNKSTIYQQFLPRRFEGIGAETPLSQLMSHMAMGSTVNVVDLRGGLIAASGQEKVYYQTDSHWNHIGAHIAYQQIVRATRQWFPRETPLPLEGFSVKPSGQKLGDLARMLGGGVAIAEKQLMPGAGCGAFVETGLPQLSGYRLNYKYGGGIVRTQCAGKPLRVIVFRDSFFTAALPYFADQYGDVIYVWDYFDQQALEEILKVFKPDLLIEERVERAL